MMKKSLEALLIAFAGAILFPIIVLAGDINSAEQGVIDTISSPQEYNGAYYKVTDAYIAKVTEYLNQDNIDMTQTEADNYIAQFHANIAVGINAGYMEKTGNVEKTDGSSEEDDSAEEEADPGDNGDQTIGSTAEGTLEYTVLPIEEETMYVSGVETLDVHAEAYKDSDVLGTLAEGEAVTVTGAASTGWAQIKYNEGVGYVSAAYLRTQGYVDSQEETVQEPEQAPKDYSNAKPVAKSLNLKAIALVIVVVFTIAIGGIIIYHKNKSKSKTRKR
ncbi:MAG: SH3 domain-containing protein [Lachnospiraceae bacterium]|nr:SH3 domain-containing protein [Lachnospiraceae bacterium]